MKRVLKINFGHLPTLVLAVGYVCFWLELYVVKKGGGVVSPLAWTIVLLFFSILIFMRKNMIQESFRWFVGEFKRCGAFTKFILIFCFLCIIAITAVVFLSLLLPPHLLPELDAINYHIGIPRQHLILGSFSHITWSSADLFVLPIQFALAPYWFVQDLPNKFIQVFFVMGLISVSASLVRRFSDNSFSSVCLIILAIFGSHGFGIQMPTAMLDIPICYLFIAFLDSLICKNVIIAATELSFLVWSKPFSVLQISALVLAIFIMIELGKKIRLKPVISFGSIDTIKIEKTTIFKIFVIFLLISFFVAAPFIVKSLYYAHTPLFPFFTGSIRLSGINENSAYWHSLVESAQSHMFHGRVGFGSGTSFVSFLRHLWLIAVPEQSVNNRFDYPIGLPYLLLLVPFAYFLFTSLRKKELPVLPVCVILYWIMWWFGAQQARFLFIPLALIFISVSALFKDIPKILVLSLSIALILNVLSIVRFNYKDIKNSNFLTTRIDVLRPSDRALFEKSKEYITNRQSGEVALNDCYITYAQFPVKVVKKCMPFVLQVER